MTGQPRRARALRLLLRLATLAVGAGAWQASTILLRRRPPDPADPPSNYGLAYEPVYFTARDDTPLAGWWIASPQPNHVTVVLVHGHNGSMDGDTAQMAELARAGFNVLMVNLRAHGAGDTASGGNQVTLGAREYQDVQGALDWLEYAQGVTQVGLVGFSMGAGLAVQVAARDERVRAVVADGALARISDGLTGYGRMRGLPGAVMQPFAWLVLALASLRAGVWIGGADPVRWAGRVRCPMLFVQGEHDPFVPYVAAESLTRLAWRAAPELWVVPGAGHRDAYQRCPQDYYPHVINFLERNLVVHD